MFAMNDASLQNVHCHGHTRLVRMVATGPGPQPQGGSGGQGEYARCGFGHNARSMAGQSSIDLADTPGMIRGKEAGSVATSTMTPSPAPVTMRSNSATDSISASATVACIPPTSTNPFGLTLLKARA